MSAGALLFLIGSWTAVLGLTGWSFRRILRPSGPAGVDAHDDGVGTTTSTSIREN